jgi:hypothetical protein
MPLCDPLCGLPTATGVGLYCGNPNPRDVSPNRLIAFRCDLLFPATGTEAAYCTFVNAAFAAGQVMDLGRVYAFDAGTAASDTIPSPICGAEKTLTGARTLVFQLNDGLDFDSTGAASPYYEYDLLGKLVTEQGKWNFGYLNCDGDLFLLANANKRFKDVSVRVDNDPELSGRRYYATYKLTLTYGKDPLVCKPFMNFNNCPVGTPAYNLAQL